MFKQLKHFDVDQIYQNRQMFFDLKVYISI